MAGAGVVAASEIKQDGAAASEGGIGGNAGVFVAAGAAEIMHKEAGWGVAGQVVIGEVAAGLSFSLLDSASFQPAQYRIHLTTQYLSHRLLS